MVLGRKNTAKMTLTVMTIKVTRFRTFNTPCGKNTAQYHYKLVMIKD